MHSIYTKPVACDDADVNLRRMFNELQPKQYNPFLLLDEIGSDEAADYISGFPSYPHCGFETVTYMLEGRMLREDHLGNKGLLQNGDVWWMTAARGIIHSEMPQQEEGYMSGFQLWVNLPAVEKMKDPSYRDIPAANIPMRVIDGTACNVIAGKPMLGGETVKDTSPSFLKLSA